MNTTTNTRGVSEAMVEQAERGWYSHIGEHGLDGSAFRDRLRAALEAALSAERAAQGEAVAEVVEDEMDDGYLIPKRARLLRDLPAGTKLYTAPPAEPAAQGEAVAAAWRYKLTDGSFQYGTAGHEVRIPRPIVEATPLYTAPPAQPAERLGVAGALADMHDAVGGCCDQLQERIKQLEAQPAERVPDGWREAFEDCYMRANEVGILHRDDDGEYTSAFTKVAWALWNERACFSPTYWWHASRDHEARTWTVHSPSGDSCEVHERAAGLHAEILRQLAQDLTASPAPSESEGGKGVDDKCPDCLGYGENCLAGRSAHPSNWYMCETCNGTGKKQATR